MRWDTNRTAGVRLLVANGKEGDSMQTTGFGQRSRLGSIGWTALAIAALGLGLVSLRYLLPNTPFPANLPNFYARRGWLVMHGAFSSIALIAGPWQFLDSFRKRWLNVHRWAGRVYCASVLGGWLTSIPIALHANTGAIASTGFLILGVFWIGSTAAGYLSARRGNVRRHREWMIRSYALTAAAITLRIYLPLLIVSGISPANSYRIVAWASWISNWLFAEWLLRPKQVRAAAAA